MQGETTAGRETDEAVCKALGIRPESTKYYPSDDDGESGYIWLDSRQEAIDWIADKNRRFPGGTGHGCKVYVSVIYPRVSEDIAAAWRVVEKMAADAPEWPHHGYFVGIHNSTGEGRWEVRIGATAVAHADSAPLAICRAAMAALAATGTGEAPA